MLTSYPTQTIALSCEEMHVATNQLTETYINLILANLVTSLASRPLTAYIFLEGVGNAAPTGQGLTDKATLIARGWQVTTN